MFIQNEVIWLQLHQNTHDSKVPVPMTNKNNIRQTHDDKIFLRIF